jgi:hypothetical protein
VRVCPDGDWRSGREGGEFDSSADQPDAPGATTAVRGSGVSATATQQAQASPVHGLRVLGLFVAVAMVGLSAALVTGATGVFNVLVFVLFAVLWLCLATALVFAPASLDDFWRAFRRRSTVVQVLGWLLFLPLAAALFVWQRRWRVGLRLVLVLAIAAVNLFMFLPRG